MSGLTGVIAIAVGGNHSLALKSDGTVWAWGFNQYGQLGDRSTHAEDYAGAGKRSERRDCHCQRRVSQHGAEVRRDGVGVGVQ